MSVIDNCLIENTIRRCPKIQPPDGGKHNAEEAPENEKRNSEKMNDGEKMDISLEMGITITACSILAEDEKEEMGTIDEHKR